MVLKYIVSPSAFTEDFEIHIWEATNDVPGGEVVTPIILPAPHAAPVTVTVNGLDKVVHIIRMYGVTTATLLHEANLEPVADTATLFAPIRFKIGDGGPNTPVAGTTGYQNAALSGLTADQYTVLRNNYGMLIPGVHYTLDDIPNGIFNLSQPGDVWSDSDEVTIQILPSALQTVVNDSVVAKLFGQTPASNDVFVDIAANTNYDPALHLRKLIRLQGNAEFTFLIDPPQGYGFTFNHYDPSLGTGKVNFSNAPLRWGATTVASINLPDFSSACFIFDGTVWNVVFLSGAVNVTSSTVGTIIHAGLFAVGDVGAGDPQFTIVHNKGIVGDYMVLWSIKTTNAINAVNPPSRLTDNDVIGTWYHDPGNKPNQFIVCLQERAAGLQDLTIAYAIIQL